jgi:group I intron endonuclease
MSDYSQGKVYKITNKINGEIYVGSTCQTLKQRMCTHISKSYKKPWFKLYQAFDKYKIDNFEVTLLELCTCENLSELRQHEQRYLDQLHPEYNSINAVHDVNYQRDYKKKYYEKNAEKIKAKTRKYVENNKEHIKVKKSKYYECNKNKVKVRQREYAEKNKDKIHQKFDCPCGGKYTHTHKARHVKTQKHQNSSTT